MFSFDSSAAREFPGLVGSANFEANFSVGFDFARFIIKSVGFDLKLLGRFCVFCHIEVFKQSFYGLLAFELSLWHLNLWNFLIQIANQTIKLIKIKTRNSEVKANFERPFSKQFFKTRPAASQPALKTSILVILAGGLLPKHNSSSLNFKHIS